MPERENGWPKSWSEWVSFVSSTLALVAGLLALGPSYETLRRDRPRVSVALHHYPTMFREMIESAYPGVAIGMTDGPDNADSEWYVFTVVNTGNRPIHLERVFVMSVSRTGPGRSTGVLPFDHILSEDKRRASFAFQSAFPPHYHLESVGVETDTGEMFSISNAEERVGLLDRW